MSKSPYLSNPNILAHPDRIVQKVELDMTVQDSYLAGSPISAEGKLANDASAIGILLYDVHKAIGGRTGVVVIFGRIKQDVAAEHSGITISAEAKAALIDITFTGDGCRMGGGGPIELPEGYPYKENVFAALVEEQAITISGGPLYNPFSVDLVLGHSYEVTWDGTVYNVTADTMDSAPYIGNLSLMGEPSDTGEPFLIATMEGMVLLMATPGEHTITVRGECVKYHTIDNNYLPEHTLVVEIDSSTMTANKTNAEIVQAVKDNKNVYAVIGDSWYVLATNPVTTNYSIRFYRITEISFAVQIETISISPKNVVTFSQCPYGIVVKSSTEGSQKRFKITVDDSGTLSAVAVS